MPSAPELELAQRTFWDLLTAPEGVASCGDEAIARARALVEGDERLDAVERLDIYADMYFYRLRDCLAEDFPKLAAVLGGAAFHNLITDYLLEHPSAFWSLRELGRALPAFLARHRLAAERPFVADLAELEWTRADLFDAADAAPLARDRLGALDAGELDRLVLTLAPACRLLSLDWPAGEVWREVEDLPEDAGHSGIHSAAPAEHVHCEHRAAVAVAAPRRRESFLRVWRRDFRVYHREIARDEHACLVELKRGATLARLGEMAYASEASEPAAVKRLGEMVDSWLDDGLLVEAAAQPVRSGS
jgi:putative DNA-binding protein